MMKDVVLLTWSDSVIISWKIWTLWFTWSAQHYDEKQEMENIYVYRKK